MGEQFYLFFLQQFYLSFLQQFYLTYPEHSYLPVSPLFSEHFHLSFLQQLLSPYFLTLSTNIYALCYIAIYVYYNHIDHPVIPNLYDNCCIFRYSYIVVTNGITLSSYIYLAIIQPLHSSTLCYSVLLCVTFLFIGIPQHITTPFVSSIQYICREHLGKPFIYLHIPTHKKTVLTNTFMYW